MGLLSWTRSKEQDSGSAEDGVPAQPPSMRSTPLIGHTLRFHDAAHDEVCAHVVATGSATVRLNVIARNVALVTSYEDAQAILAQQWNETPSVSRKQAYDMLMSAFYSPPNLLLEDEDDGGAREHREDWRASIAHTISTAEWQKSVEASVKAWQGTLDDNSTDLYDACKELGHGLALGTFLGIHAQNEQSLFDESRKQSEAMLRGQFTLPVGLNVGFFQNTFSRGQAAKVKFDAMIAERIAATKAEDGTVTTCPFAVSSGGLSDASLVSHHSMFASSLVVKAFASLATALLLQLWHTSQDTQGTLAEQLVSQWKAGNAAEADALLDSIMTETERVSPPIIGVMRRVIAKDGITLQNSGRLGNDGDSQTPSQRVRVPTGWDAWPYFPLANRDASVFGSDSRAFNAKRYMSSNSDDARPPAPLSFGAGVKACPGREVIRTWLRSTVKAILLSGTTMTVDQHALDEGVQDWLGWTPTTHNVTWKGMKQLPTQRPRKPIMVTFTS